MPDFIKKTSVTMNSTSLEQMNRMRNSLSRKKGLNLTHPYFIDILSNYWSKIEKLIIKEMNNQ